MKLLNIFFTFFELIGVIFLFHVLYPSRIVMYTIWVYLVFFLEDTFLIGSSLFVCPFTISSGWEVNQGKLLCLSLGPLSGPSNGVAAKPLYLLSIPGEYLALTGEKLNGAEMLSCGLATHFSPLMVLPTDHNFIYFGYGLRVCFFHYLMHIFILQFHHTSSLNPLVETSFG